MVQVYGRFWNGLWGNWNRRWVWLEYLDEEPRWQVRWRDGSDRPDRWARTKYSDDAVDELCRIMGANPVGEWREIPVDL